MGEIESIHAPLFVPIIAAGAEGGSITLEGFYSDGAWQFRVRMSDCSDEEGQPISRHSAWTT